MATRSKKTVPKQPEVEPFTVYCVFLSGSFEHYAIGVTGDFNARATAHRYDVSDVLHGRTAGEKTQIWILRTCKTLKEGTKMMYLHLHWWREDYGEDRVLHIAERVWLPTDDDEDRRRYASVYSAREDLELYQKDKKRKEGNLEEDHYDDSDDVHNDRDDVYEYID
jgi:hypothetical protein